MPPSPPMEWPLLLPTISTLCHLSVFLCCFFFFFILLLRHKRQHAGSAAATAISSSQQQQQQQRRRHDNHLLFLLTSLALTMLYLSNFAYFCFKLVYHGNDDDDHDQLFSVSYAVDMAARTLAWLSISVFLLTISNGSSSRSSNILLGIWCLAFLLLSVFSLCFHLSSSPPSSSSFAGGGHRTLLVAVDAVSILAALLLNLATIKNYQHWRRNRADVLQEPLLYSSNNGGMSENAANTAAAATPTSAPASLFTNASFFSILTFSWLGPLLSAGYKKPLDLDDVPSLDYNDSVDAVLPLFTAKLDSSSHTSTASGAAAPSITAWKLAKALMFSNLYQVILTAIYALVYNLATYVGPYLIDDFVQYLGGSGRTNAGQGYRLVFLFIVSKLIEGLSQRHWFFRVQQAGVRVRAALTTTLYQKGLKLSTGARQGRSSGEMINIMSVDVERVGLFSWYLHDIWLVPVQVGLALLILSSTLGSASLAALAATFLVMLANVPLGKMQQTYQKKMMESKDVRMKGMSEALRNMRILKLQGWEMKFLSRITELRKTETNWLRKYIYTSAMTSFVFWGAPTFVAVATFGACIVMDIPLQSGKVLSALATFGVLQEPIYTLPDTISMVIQTKVSLERIASFLCLDELPGDVVQKLPKGGDDDDGLAIEVKNGNFCWKPPVSTSSDSSDAFTLKELNFRVKTGMHVAVCGTVGSGKSTLLSCLLGEVPKLSGEVKLCGMTAYVSQIPWIRSGKIQENILFGKEMDREKYDRVLQACALDKDMVVLPFGDQTMIGERGINLSGGQKQRVQIARALYQDADIYLFDDPFSAVDAHTGSHLFKKCLMGILASKTVVYVTHQVEFLPSADCIMVMTNGRIAQYGKYEEILDSGAEFMELVGAHKDAISTIDKMELKKASIKEGESKLSSSDFEGINSNVDMNEKDNEKGQLVQEEERKKGSVEFAVYWKYITLAYKGAFVPFIVLAQILYQTLQIVSNYWMAWAAPVSKDMQPPVPSSTLVSVYVALAIGSSFCILARSLLLGTAGYKTATILFNRMHRCIFRAPMSFFDSTPSGRILNRASTDQSTVDTDLANQTGSLVFATIQLIGIVVVMSQVAWQVFIVFIPVLVACLWFQRRYIATARELQRLSVISKSPIIQHFAESMAGAVTIRSFGKEKQFIGTNYHLMDDYSRPKFHNAAAREWMCFRLDILSSLTFSFSLVFLITMPAGFIDPGIAGLAVTYGLNLNMLQAWVVWNLCNLQNSIISVERILQYTSIPSEPPLAVEENRLDKCWPLHGEIKLHDIFVRYAPQLPFVLKGLTCDFKGGKKTGIVGRTGSGKSTLIQTLFRIVDPTAGHIVIDGVDISTIGLHELRSRLSIIPQDPTMFEGTVRTNLDPLEEYNDEQIWEALDACQLGEVVRSKELKLDTLVTENGENWSAGQRQLVCLGRVILKRSRILVLDEATASVDTATDNLIQITLRRQFSESTVLTVAHRITSVLDSDMVLLLDNGAIAEHDTPRNLLEDESSLFSKLVMEFTARSTDV